MDQVEREIRNSVVDILCFLSSGKATESQMAEIEKKVSLAAEVAKGSFKKEKVEA